MLIELIFWTGLGALIGIAAAQRRGFNMLGAVIGGALLGPFAFLLFLVSGVTRSDMQRRKCPHCAEWIKGEAMVCKHCGRDVGTRMVAPRSGASPATRR